MYKRQVLDGTLIVGDIEKRFEQGSVVVAAANPDVLEDYICLLYTS